MADAINSNADLALRDKLRQEVRDSVERRRAQLRAFLVAHGDQLTAEERAYLAKRNADFSGRLFDILGEFLNLDTASQVAALDGPSFVGLPWSPLMQSHPYFFLERWKTFFAEPSGGAGSSSDHP
jgi:hypothetical protein